MRLSILIPSVPSRIDDMLNLFYHLTKSAEGKEIEILVLTDNKKRTIGEKREALKNLARGKYFMFVDDDDWLISLDEIYEAAEKDVDVITFKQRCILKGNDYKGEEFIVTFGIGNEIEVIKADCKRPPFHVCAWASKYKEFKFPSLNYNEDTEWLKQLNPKTEFHINKVLHEYRFDNDKSEAVYETSKAIVNYATDKYLEGQARLRKSLVEFMEYSPIMYGSYFNNEQTLDCPSHEENPYAFKIYAIEKVKETGIQQIFWLDASVIAVKPIQPVFDYLTKHQIFMEEAGHWVGSWCNDYTLDYFKITREEAFKIPMFAAGYVGFDFRTEVSNEFFAKWKESMLNGCFKGSHADHRHDMTCGSIIAYQMGLIDRYSKGGTYFAYIGEVFGEPKETVCFYLKGV